MTKICVLISRTGEKQAAGMLSELIFRPVLGWAAEALRPEADFLAACREEEREKALSCMRQGQSLRFEAEDCAPCELLVLARPAIVSRETLAQAREQAKELGVSALALLDEQGERAGVYYFPCAGAGWALGRMENPDGFEAAVAAEGLVMGEAAARALVSLGTPAALQNAQQALRTAVIARHMGAGVNFLDPASALIGPEVTIGAGTVILPGVILRGKTVVGEDCEIGPNCMVCDSTVGDRSVVNSSQIFESSVGAGAKIGPFAYVRPGCRIADNVKLGDFVELKNASVGRGSKIPHLSYVGDATVGEGVNIGCGSITVNYDGKKKHMTQIGDRAFIGCNSNLVAPVKVGEDAFTAAGSTVTRDVPDGALAVARARQDNKEGWVEMKRRHGELK